MISRLLLATRAYNPQVLQMIGRAGRPQFDRCGLAVIVTDTNSEIKYRNLTAGLEKIESGYY